MHYFFSLGLIFGFLISIGYCEHDTLLLVQAVWRSGARATFDTYKNDPLNGTWHVQPGELTELGMRQHFYLGKMLRDIYVNDLKFLNISLRNNEIYVRSSDANRSMTSATSNIIGMYLNSGNLGGYSYPNSKIPGWPTGYFPFPIHTLNNFNDYTLNPERSCLRFDDLKAKITETQEYINLSAQKKEVLDKLSKIVDETVTLSNISKIADIISNQKMMNLTKMADELEEIFDEIIQISEITESWENGLNLQIHEGVDFSIEIPTIRGGNLLWAIIENMQMMKSCSKDSSQKFCTFFQTLKYYAYSAHDPTIAALLSTLKMNHTNYNEDGFPQYASAITIELWQKDDGSDYIKFAYFTVDPTILSYDSHIKEDLLIPGCKTANTTLCTLDTFTTISTPYKPSPDSATLCNTPLGETPSVTTSTVKAKESSANSITVLSFIPLIFALILNN